MINQELIIKDYKEIFDVAEFTARKYFNHYRNIFLATNFESDDLIQESRIKVLETLNRYSQGQYKILPKNTINRPPNNGVIYKTYDEVFASSNQAVGWKLKNILEKCKNELKVFKLDENNKRVETKDLLFPVSLIEEMIPSVNIPDNIKFKFEELHIVLTDKEYDIIYDIFYKGRTHDSIAKSYKCSRQYITKIYTQAMRKIKNYLGLKETGLTNL